MRSQNRRFNQCDNNHAPNNNQFNIRNPKKEKWKHVIAKPKNSKKSKTHMLKSPPVKAKVKPQKKYRH